MFRHLLVFLLIIVSFCVLASRLADVLATDAVLNKVNAVYGDAGLNRVKQWLALVNESGSDNEWNQLNKVNTFFNKQIRYQNDLPLWGKNDYWASPVEMLGVGSGDCEDYAIGKFFTLLSLGVPEEKMRLMYVRQLTVNEPHMVLIYFEQPNSIPLVLDNFDPRIKSADKRRDLKPIYSFNGQGLWMAKAKGLGKKVENSRGNSAWDSLTQRIENGEMNTIDKVNSKGPDYAKL
ncbi:transglutaminase-like cysteine peptidase [Pseudoalteromonas tunicata]|uniref:transglutaminase-like cysteine peptidase n=1 Tax=Pseudoalteromonas tunicata TaxID=314281 RepID=UPI0027400E1D|nr:transglutaminase-like cysteine peptidase [Pseudoalteromonas tunicata]MDP4983638.1 transglutaminase-like cysteine peptidase [Pseudoalteromonas tunicata]